MWSTRRRLRVRPRLKRSTPSHRCIHPFRISPGAEKRGSRSHGRRRPKLTNPLLSWPDERFNSSLCLRYRRYSAPSSREWRLTPCCRVMAQGIGITALTIRLPFACLVTDAELRCRARWVRQYVFGEVHPSGEVLQRSRS